MANKNLVQSRTLKIKNARGLHARAAAKFAEIVLTFNADVTVEKGGQTVSGNSIMGLMMLAASTGTQIKVESKGKYAKEALKAIIDLVENNFDEE